MDKRRSTEETATGTASDPILVHLNRHGMHVERYGYIRYRNLPQPEAGVAIALLEALGIDIEIPDDLDTKSGQPAEIVIKSRDFGLGIKCSVRSGQTRRLAMVTLVRIPNRKNCWQIKEAQAN